MNILIERANAARCENGEVVIDLASGSQLRFPIAKNPRLARGTPQQLNRIDISPVGLHWPELDEDLSLRGIAEGDYGQQCK